VSIKQRAVRFTCVLLADERPAKAIASDIIEAINKANLPMMLRWRCDSTDGDVFGYPDPAKEDETSVKGLPSHDALKALAERVAAIESFLSL
jgi:hypothetical protein